MVGIFAIFSDCQEAFEVSFLIIVFFTLSLLFSLTESFMLPETQSRRMSAVSPIPGTPFFFLSLSFFLLKRSNISFHCVFLYIYRTIISFFPSQSGK